MLLVLPTTSPPVARRHDAYKARKAEWEQKNPTLSYPHSPPVADSQRGSTARYALSEICHYQKAEGFLVPKIPFQCLVREVMQSVSHPGQKFKFQSTAIAVLQEVAEAYLASFFEATNMCAIHAGQVTIKSKDI